MESAVDDLLEKGSSENWEQLYRRARILIEKKNEEIRDLKEKVQQQEEKALAAEMEIKRLKEGHSGNEPPRQLNGAHSEIEELQVEVSWLRRQLMLAAHTPSDRPVAAGPSLSEKRTGERRSSESWQDLRHIQYGCDKWFKVASADYGSAAKRAHEALLEAERDLARSSERVSKYRETWTPPSASRPAGYEGSDAFVLAKKLEEDFGDDDDEDGDGTTFV